MRKTIRLPDFSPFTAGGTSTLAMPVGLTYDLVLLELIGNETDELTADKILDIEVRANGKTLQEYKSGAQINALNNYYNRGSSPGFVVLWFIRPELTELRYQRMTALGTADLQTLSLHLKLASDAPAGSKVIAHAVQSEPQPLGVITKVKSFPVTFATGGEQDISNIPRNGARIAAMHLESTVDVSKVRVSVNSVDVFEASDKLAAEVQNRYDRVADEDSTIFRVDWMLEGDMAQALITAGVQDMRIKPTIASAGQVDVLVEYLDGFAGI